MTVVSKWSVRFTEKAQKSFEKLDFPIQRRIQKFLRERVLKAASPREWGKALTGDLSGFWSYRVGEYRLLCKIEDKELLILVVHVAHRKDVYD